MRKTSVYLADDEATALKRVADATGIPQSELIRDGIRRAVEAHEPKPRVFHSMGKGRGDGTGQYHWTDDELYAKVFSSRQQ